MNTVMSAAALSLMLGLSPTGFAQDHPTASDLLKQGLQQIQAGQLNEARVTLTRVDAVQLNKDERLQLKKAYDAIKEKQAAAPATPAAAAPAAPAAKATEAAKPMTADDMNKAAAEARAAAAEAEKKAQAAKAEAEAKAKAEQDLVRAAIKAKADLAAEARDRANLSAEQKAKLAADEAATAAAAEKAAKESADAKAKADAAAADAKAKAADATAKEAQAKAANGGKTPAAAPVAAKKEDLLDQAAKLRAQALEVEAAQAMKNGEYNRAETLYLKSLQLDPTSATAKKGLDDTQLFLKRGAGNILDTTATDHKLRGDQAQALYSQNMEVAVKAYKAGNYTQAADAATLAKTVIDTNRQYLNEATYNAMRDQALNVKAEVDKKAEEQRVKKLAETEGKIKGEQNDRQRTASEERQRKVQQLLARAVDLRNELKYEEALDVLEQLLFWDKNNIAAQALKQATEDAIIYRNHINIERRRGGAIQQQRNDNFEASIPIVDLMAYPPDWPQITQTRRDGLGLEEQESDINKAVRQKLKTVIPVNFDGQEFGSVIDFFKNITATNFFVNWKALQAASIEPANEVRLQLSAVPAEKALELVLEQLSSDTAKLEYVIEDGVVVISTKENLSRNVITRTYDIRDLLVQVPDFKQAPKFDLNEITRSNSGGGGGGGGSLFDEEDTDEELPSRQERVDSIINLITTQVTTEDWKKNGGNVGNLTEYNGNLIISHTPRAHKELLTLLGQLRETQALQINVEARFLLVDQNYLHEVGVDIDVTYDVDGDNWGPIGIQQDSATIAQRINTTLPGSFGGDEFRDNSGGTGTPPAGGAASNTPYRRSLQITGSFLDDLQVNFLIRATKADRRSVVLSAPRVTFMNGQRAYVVIARQIAYISDLTPIIGTNSVGFDPEVSVVSSGVVLDVEGTISADRRYVTLTARPSLATVRSPLRTVEVTAAAGGNGGGVFGGGNQQNQQASLPTGNIEVPELELTSVRTTVSVPDKGTLLLGGQRLLGEIEIESGVPVLSNVPLLNRLFTNRATIKDERTLLILIKPTIIVQSERENNAFPGLEQSPDLLGEPTRK